VAKYADKVDKYQLSSKIKLPAFSMMSKYPAIGDN
jgi:hypothetical protein